MRVYLAMRKLNEFYRALSKFLVDPAGHITRSWALVKGALPISGREEFANAVVVIDHMVEAVAFFAKAQANKPKQTDLPEEGQGG